MFAPVDVGWTGALLLAWLGVAAVEDLRHGGIGLGWATVGAGLAAAGAGVAVAQAGRSVGATALPVLSAILILEGRRWYSAGGGWGAAAFGPADSLALGSVAAVFGVGVMSRVGAIAALLYLPWRRSIPARVPFIPAIAAATLLLTVPPMLFAIDRPAPARVEQLTVAAQPIRDVLLTFAEETGVSVVVDATVDGTTDLVLHRVDAETTLQRLSEATGLFFERRAGVYWFSRVRVIPVGIGRFDVQVRQANLNSLPAVFAARMGRSVVAPTLEAGRIDLELHAVTPEEAFQAALAGNARHAVEYGSHGVIRVVARNATPTPEVRRPAAPLIQEDAEQISVVARAMPLFEVLRALAAHAAVPLVELTPLPGTVEAVDLRGRTLAEIVAQLPAAVGVEVVEAHGSWYAHSLDREWVRRQITDYARFAPVHTTAAALIGALPPYVRNALTVQPALRGSVIHAVGLPTAIAELARWVERLDQPETGTVTVEFSPVVRAAAEMQAIAERHSTPLRVAIDAATNSFVATVPAAQAPALLAALRRADQPDEVHLIRTAFREARVIIEALPPGVDRTRVRATADGSGVLVYGQGELVRLVRAVQALVDTSALQIRYDLCIVQYQRGESSRYGFSATVQPGQGAVSAFEAPVVAAGAFDQLLSLQFDFLTAFGYQAALSLTREVAQNGASVIVDTSLRAGDGQTARLRNTNTFRYRDPLMEGDTRPIVGVTREIVSGLEIELTGTIAGDGSVLVDARIAVSKRGNDYSGGAVNPPPTSHRAVETQLRLYPGVPVVVGGLLQREEDQAHRLFPILGRIPLVGRFFRSSSTTREETEMVLYLIARPEYAIGSSGHETHQRTQLARLLSEVGR